MNRPICDACGYPLKTCICHGLIQVDNRTPVVVLQHPSEVKQSKNTAKLLALCLKRCDVLVGEQFTPTSEVIKHYSLVFPDQWPVSNRSITSESKTVELTLPATESGVILLDGTWKKVKKMIFLNPWLAELPRISFDGVTNDYWIRKSPSATALSTLEATGLALDEVEPELDAYSRLSQVLTAFQRTSLPRDISE